MRNVRLLTRGFEGRPAYDTAVSRALLGRVAKGDCAESLRLYVPDDVVAFSVLDRVRPGFEKAVAAARANGFDAMLRLAGGRAAVFTRQSLAFAWCVPVEDGRRDIHGRFQRLAEIVQAALLDLGLDARIGAVPGEYCPGDHSVNARGARKLMGVGQRLVQGAAHVGGVIVVRDAQRIAKVLEPIYRAMELEFAPEAVGSIDQEDPQLTVDDVRSALLARFREDLVLEGVEPEPELLALAEEYESEHRIA